MQVRTLNYYAECFVGTEYLHLIPSGLYRGIIAYVNPTFLSGFEGPGDTCTQTLVYASM